MISEVISLARRYRVREVNLLVNRERATQKTAQRQLTG
jgi:hypothetical protein